MVDTKVTVAGKNRDAKQIEVLETTRPWADFLLEDGSRLRVNIFIDAVHRLEGEYDQRGNPVYFVNARTASSTFSPENLRKVD